MEEQDFTVDITLPVGNSSIHITYLELTEEGDIIVEYDESDTPVEAVQAALVSFIESAVAEALKN